MQEVKKETDFGLGRGTEKVCGLRESLEGYFFQERSSPMVRVTASRQASGHMSWPLKGLLQGVWGEQPEATGPGSLGAEGMATHFSAHCAQSGRTVDEPTELVIGRTRQKR